MPANKGITIRHVAAKAGVSVAAVSQALNGKGALSAATREHIKAVAAAMDYQADALARGLKNSSMGVVGLVVRSLDALGDYNPRGVDVFARISGAIAAEALDRGMGLMLLPDLSRKPIPPMAFSLDGYIVMNPHINDPVLELLERKQIPYVCLGRDVGRPEFTRWVSQDERKATTNVLDEFHRAGARSVVFVGGTDQNAWNLDSEGAYRMWALARGIKQRSYHVAEREGAGGGRNVATQIIAEGLPEAIFCLTGRHASGILEALLAQGISVPGDVLIAAGSDSEHSRSSSPAISAIEMVPEPAAAGLVAMLHEILRGGDPVHPCLLETRFLPRASTAR